MIQFRKAMRLDEIRFRRRWNWSVHARWQSWIFGVKWKLCGAPCKCLELWICLGPVGLCGERHYTIEEE